MSDPTGVSARGVEFRYGTRQALDGVDFTVATGAVHGFLGPNGSGKSTLFRLLATILPPQRGELRVLGLDLARDAAAIRRRLGVVFQHPALDRKLTVLENLRYGGRLYGLTGAALTARIDEMLEHARLTDRRRDLVGELSGGLRRRVEIAKGLLHRPELLVLDEPSTGLDPGARQDLWRFLRAQPEITVLFTTHLMDEADEADRLTILHEGRVVADGTPDALRARIGGEVLEIITPDPTALANTLAERSGIEAAVFAGVVRVERERAHLLIPEVIAIDPDVRIRIGRPSLEDVFIRETGHRLWEDA